jgi:periplasmic copper chaperone A
MVPTHKPGWNKFTVPVAVDNLPLFFSDAQIVWKGTAAFSPNASVTDLIAGTQGVTALSALQAGDEIWVKY